MTTDHTPPADRAALRDRIAEALIAWTYRGRDPEHGGILETVRANAYSRADAVLAVLPPPVSRADVLREAAAVADGFKQVKVADFLRGMAEQAELRRMADEAQPGADEADVDLTDGPVRCPLCPNPVTLHTPNGARAHFTAVHPEQRITGRGPGPWPLLVTDGDEAQPGTEAPRKWCKCRSCWGWFVEEHPGEDLDELGKDLGWWSGLPEHRDAPAAAETRQDGARS